MPPHLSPEPCSLPHPSERHYNSDLSIWLSVDPMSDKYPSMSPYTYCANNPVKLVDPDGREVWIRGDDAESAFARLQQATNLKLTMEDDGKISADGKPLNANDLQLYRAIKSSKVVVNIETVSDEKDCPNGGQYMGTEYKPGQTTSTNSVYLKKLNSYEKSGAEGSGMMHEITEGYQLGLHALEIKRSIDKALLHQEMDGFTIMMGGKPYESWHWEPDNKEDYDIYWNYGHTRATQQPSTMTTEQAKYYKYPVFRVIMSHLQNFQR